ncbi:hypothetical protein NOVOSPHI9U_10276 [Novosphingobium sp. 9U]|nr:hypothetical protein NOVOSPHI9U_10276 [Novosphingobium sp. 9U]
MLGHEHLEIGQAAFVPSLYTRELAVSRIVLPRGTMRHREWRLSSGESGSAGRSSGYCDNIP